MMRQTTPNVLDAIFNTPAPLPAVQLRWDYSQAGEHAAAVQGHAVNIKRHEAKATAEIIAAGEDFIAVKALLGHGQWLDWLDVEFRMTDRTALNMMRIAAEFGDKSETVSDLSTSVLYMLAAPSTPEPARQAVIDASANGQRVTKELAREIIAEHKPAPRTVSPAPAASTRTYQVNGPALPAWVAEARAHWSVIITDHSDAAAVGKELRAMGVDSDWMEALWDGYMEEK
jgi:hypothetical protein